MNARADTLKLRWREWMTEEGRNCAICGYREETLEHFLLECERLKGIRCKYIELQSPMNEDHELIIANVLMYDKSTWKEKEYYVDMIYELWNERKRLIEGMSVTI